MDNLVASARQRLIDGGYTCVLLQGDEEYTSLERGVKPLIGFLQSGKSFTGSVAADKTVGAGAAHLYVLLGVRALWSNVISASALEILKNIGIEVSYGECVPHIINRRGDGICPIETAVSGAKTSDEAYSLILDTLARLNAK